MESSSRLLISLIELASDFENAKLRK